MIDEAAVAEFMKQLAYDVNALPRKAFIPEVIDKLVDEFCIDHAQKDVVGSVLEFGAAQWLHETERAKIDFKRVRMEFERIIQVAEAARDALLNLSDDAQRILVETGEARTIAGSPMPRVAVGESALTLNYVLAPNSESRSILLGEISSILSSLAQCAVDAGPSAGVNKRGKPPDEALSEFLSAGFVVWTKVLERPFKLDWTSDGEPITDAARFSVRIVRIVAPETTLSKIVTTTRSVRKHINEISNLQEFHLVAGLFPQVV